MIIRNISGKILNLGFIGHGVKLIPNATFEVEENLVEDLSFQKMENSGLLEIVSYEADPTRLAVKQELDDVINNHEARISSLEVAGSVAASQEYTLGYWSSPSTATHSLYHENTYVQQIPVRFNSFLTRAYIQVSNPRSSGAIEVKPTRNGVVIPNTTLDLNIGLADPQEQTKNIAVGTPDFEFEQGDKLGAQIQFSSFAPQGSNILVSYVLTQT